MRLFLGGDVMLGRGVDQILPHPGDPTLYERSIRDARGYVELAEAANGPIAWPVDYSWPWGDALEVLDNFDPDVRLVNLETSITRSEDFALDKGIHYRMSPDNLPVLSAARLDVCSLANNHILDFGITGLEETLDALNRAGIAAAGAGRSGPIGPAVVEASGGRVVVLSFGTTSSGVPAAWAATVDRPGIALLPDLSDRTAAAVTAEVSRVKRAGDVVVVSVHWGPNWGYDVTTKQVRFAHRLIEGGVDVVHGHSSHTSSTATTSASSTSPPWNPAASPVCAWPPCKPTACACARPHQPTANGCATSSTASAPPGSPSPRTAY